MGHQGCHLNSLFKLNKWNGVYSRAKNPTTLHQGRKSTGESEPLNFSLLLRTKAFRTYKGEGGERRYIFLEKSKTAKMGTDPLEVY